MEKIIVNKNDLENNIDIIKKYVKDNKQNSNPRIIGVVKGNGYGLGLVEFSNVLLSKGIDMLAVSKVDEAVKLRDANFVCDILFLSSTCLESEIKDIISNEVIPTIGSIESLKEYELVAKKINQVVNVHIAIETGFSRHGISLENINDFINEYHKCENVKIIGAFSHFISSFDNSSKSVDVQNELFMKMVNILKENGIDNLMLHLCNSSAVLKYPKYYYDAVRIGSAFTGRIQINNTYGLKRIGYLQSQISEIKEIKTGDKISYGGIYVAKKDMKIAIVQTGYTSGINVYVRNNTWKFMTILREIRNILRISKDNAFVKINNVKYDIVSNIRMNNIIIDITNSNVKIGDMVDIDISPMNVDSSIERKYI